MVAAVLHLDEGSAAALNRIDHVGGRLAHAHDVVDAHLLGIVDAEIGQRAIGLRVHLVVVADDEIDLVHGAELLRLDLGGTAGDDDAGLRVVAACPPIAWRA